MERQLWNRLESRGILRHKNGEGVTLTVEFTSSISEMANNESLARENVRDEYENLVDIQYTDNPEFYHILKCLDDRIEGADRDTLVKITPILLSMYENSMGTSTPLESFTEVSGDTLEVFTSVFSRVVVYVWKEDCPPCETVEDDLREIFDSNPTSQKDPVPLSIFGPEWSDILQKRYDVVGAPTLLFIHDSDVYSRLQGACYPSAIRREIEFLANH